MSRSIPLLICCTLFFGNNAALFAQGARMTSLATKIDVHPDRLLTAPVAENWLSYNGDYTGRRFSALEEIGLHNVAQLRAQWVFHAPNSNRLEVTPVVADEVMFVT